LDVVKKVESLEPVAPRKINPHIPRDLETVILKCLEKDKTRRYGSARDLADDLTRWLDGDAVQARPASTFYRLRLKLARRKAIVTVTAVAAAALAGALGWWLTVGSPGVEYAREFTSAMKLWAEARIAANTGGDPEGIGRRARQAREGFEQALHRRETAEGQLMRGRCLQLEGDNVAALKALEAAHRLEPGNAEARLELAKELLLKYHESRGFPAPVHLYVTGGSNVLRFETLPAETKEQRQWRERADQLLHSGGVAPGKAALLEGLQAMAKGDYAKAATALALYGKSESWDVTVLHLEGACRFCARDFSGAIAAMDQSLKRVRSAPCFGYRGLANLALGRYAEAIADLTEAIKLDPRVPKFHVHRGNAKHKFGLLDQAVEDFTQAIEIDPTLAVAYANRALVRGDLGRTDEAIEDYTKAIEIDPHYAMAYQGRGSVKKDLGLVHEAAEDLQKAVQLDPKRASAHVVLGILQCDELREYQAALKSFDQAIALDPDLAIAYRNRAVAKLHLRQLDRAVADLDKAVVLDPKMSGAYRMRGYIKCQLSRPDEGISDYTTAISLDPEDGLAYAGRAKALVMKGLLRESISDFDKAIDINPRNAQAVHNRALTKYRLSQYEEAIEGFTRVIEIDAKWVDAYFQRGRANQSMGRLKEALPDYSKAIELDPNLADAWHLRGDIHEVTGNVDQAVADWGKALDVAPPTWGGRSETVRHLDKYRKDSSRAARIREGQAGFDQSLELLLGKNYAEALKGFRKLAEEFPDLNLGLNSTYNVACCHALLGDKNEALNWLEKAIVLGWNDPAHIEQDTDLESLRGEERYRKLVEKLKAK
jgi:tetratricopeptide (TPR) repeat protein